MQRCRLIIILWCMLENIHEAKLLQPMASGHTDIKAAWPSRASIAQRYWHASQRESPILVLLAPLCKNIEWPAHLICRISNRTLVYFVVGLSQDLLKQFNVGSCKLRVRIYFAVGKRAREQRFHFFSSWSRRFHTFTASRPACTLLDTSLCNQTLLIFTA